LESRQRARCGAGQPPFSGPADDSAAADEAGVQDRERERARVRVRPPALLREPPLLREVLARLRDAFLPFAPPVRLFTVAQAIRSAVFELRPRPLALRSIFDAIRFCFEL